MHNGEFHAFTIINVLMWFQARGYGGKNPLWPAQKWRMKKNFNSTKKEIKKPWFIYLFNFTIHHSVPQLTFKSLCLLKCRPCLATSIARGYFILIFHEKQMHRSYICYEVHEEKRRDKTGADSDLACSDTDKLFCAFALLLFLTKTTRNCFPYNWNKAQIK